MIPEAVDEVAEREFRFMFKGLNFFALHEFFIALNDFGGSVVLENSYGVKWTPNDGEHALREHFSDPGIQHTAMVRTEKELKLYKSIFDNFPNYVEYDGQ